MLHDDLADGDRHLIQGPGLRRVYVMDRDTQSLRLHPTEARHLGVDAARRIDHEAADLANDRYLRGLGWGD